MRLAKKHYRRQRRRLHSSWRSTGSISFKELSERFYIFIVILLLGIVLDASDSLIEFTPFRHNNIIAIPVEHLYG